MRLTVQIRHRKDEKNILVLNRLLLCLSGQMNGTNRTEAFVKELLAPEMKIVGGATC